jgi:hypothetical protein
MVSESVDTVSRILFDFVRGAKMFAKCSSVTLLGIVCVTEIGRWSEKKLDRLRAEIPVSIKLVSNMGTLGTYLLETCGECWER